MNFVAAFYGGDDCTKALLSISRGPGGQPASSITVVDDGYRIAEIYGSQSTIVRDAELSEAIGFLCYGEWGKNFFDAAAARDVDGAAEFDIALQAAADGSLPIWGKRSQFGVYEPIPKEYWYDHRFEWFSLLRGKAHSESSKSSFTGDKYLDLMTSRAATQRLKS